MLDNSVPRVRDWYDTYQCEAEYDWCINYKTLNQTLHSSLGMVDVQIIRFLESNGIECSLDDKSRGIIEFLHRHWEEASPKKSNDVWYIAQTSNYLPPARILQSLQEDPCTKLTVLDYSASELRGRSVPCSVLHHGIDSGLLVTPNRVNQPFTFISVAQRGAFKAIEFSLEAFKILRSKYSDLRYVVVGIKEKKASDGVTYIPRIPQSEVFEWYAKSHVLVCPSAWESFCNPVLEASCSGMTVIVNDIPVFRSEFFLRHTDLVRVASKEIVGVKYALGTHFAPNDLGAYRKEDLPIYHEPILDSLVSEMESAYLNYREKQPFIVPWNEVFKEERLAERVIANCKRQLAMEPLNLTKKSHVNQKQKLDQYPHLVMGSELKIQDGVSLLLNETVNTSLIVNHVTQWIWEQIDGNRTVGNIVALAIELLPDANASEITQDIVATLDLFGEQGLIYLDDSPFSICLIAIGTQYVEWAKICIDLIRRPGDYQGAIYVVTNHPKMFAGMSRVYSIYSESESRIFAKRWKTQVLGVVPRGNALYLDVDVLVCGPINAFIKQYVNGDKEFYMFPDSGTSGQKYHTGVFFARQGAEDLLSRWCEQLDSGNHKLDQSAFNAAARSSAIQQFNEKDILFPTADDLEQGVTSLFVHLTMTGRQQWLSASAIRTYLINVINVSFVPRNILLRSKMYDYEHYVEHSHPLWLEDDQYLYYDGQNKLANKKIFEQAGLPVPRLIATYETAEEIDFENLPSSYVIKPSHLAGGQGVFLVNENVDVNTRRPISKNEIVRTLSKFLRSCQSGPHREYVDQHIGRRIIVEELMLDENGQRPGTLEIAFSYGSPIEIKLARVKEDGSFLRQYYSQDWQLIDFDEIRSVGTDPYNELADRPDNLGMIISQCKHALTDVNFPLIRIQIYLVGKNYYFGEFTINSGGGKMSSPWMGVYRGLAANFPGFVKLAPFSPQFFSKENKWKKLEAIMQLIESNNFSKDCLMS